MNDILMYKLVLYRIYELQYLTYSYRKTHVQINTHYVYTLKLDNMAIYI